jgi:hypothetical protein
MNRSDIGRVHHQATRTAIPGTTRQSTAAAPVGSRGGAFQRSADQVRGAPSHRTDTDDDDDDKDKDEKKPIDDVVDIDDDNLPKQDSDDDEDDPKKAKKAS